MFLDLLLRILEAAALIAVIFFLPRWVPWLSLRQAYSTHDVLQGEHGLDRFAHVVIFGVLFGFLLFLALKLAPLFHAGEVAFWAVVVGIGLALLAASTWPRRRPPNEWHL